MADPKESKVEWTEHEAIEQFQKAVKDDQDAHAHFNLGSAYYVSHDLDNALREFQEAVARAPNIDHAHYYLGVIYAKHGEYDKSREELNKVLNGSGNSLLKDQAKIQLAALPKK